MGCARVSGFEMRERPPALLRTVAKLGPMRTQCFRGSRRRMCHRATRGRAERRRVARRAVRRRRRSRLFELPLITLVALVLALLLKTFLMQMFVIPSGSMENTLDIGDRVVVDKLSPWFGDRPHRGDVVVFHDPGGWLETDRQNTSGGPVLRTVTTALSFAGLFPADDRRNLIKRVIGVGGDTVACCDDHGRITVNGVAVNEPYLAPGNAPSQQTFVVTVPMGRIWVMGDHRDVSADSRFHMGSPGQGTIPLTSVVGRAVAIVWPVPRIRHLDAPASFSSLPTAAEGLGHARPSPDPDHFPTQPPSTPAALGVLVLPAGWWQGRRRRRASSRGIPPCPPEPSTNGADRCHRRWCVDSS
ncbi:signal peptidase I [Kitasatospora sp. NPDC059577]|uniref:signal peptidase I n=1 Tax=Kitasatospora sp. NPDC059577 TaxID=3346873 RepID=UPI0036893013